MGWGDGGHQFGNTVRWGCSMERLSVNWFHWPLKAAHNPAKASNPVNINAPKRQDSKATPSRLSQVWMVLSFFMGRIVVKGNFIAVVMLQRCGDPDPSPSAILRKNTTQICVILINQADCVTDFPLLTPNVPVSAKCLKPGYMGRNAAVISGMHQLFTCQGLSLFF